MCTSATMCHDETKLLHSNLRSLLLHFHANLKSIELLNKSLSVLNMQEVSNMNWYQSLWFKYFLGAAKDYSYFFFEGGGVGEAQEQNCRTIFLILFSDHSIVLNTLAVYSKSEKNTVHRRLFILQICLFKGTLIH